MNYPKYIQDQIDDNGYAISECYRCRNLTGIDPDELMGQIKKYHTESFATIRQAVDHVIGNAMQAVNASVPLMLETN